MTKLSKPAFTYAHDLLARAKHTGPIWSIATNKSGGAPGEPSLPCRVLADFKRPMTAAIPRPIVCCVEDSYSIRTRIQTPGR
jgi:hypothetical protein